MDVKQIGWEIMEWIYLDNDRENWRVVLSVVMNVRVP
jgi:hypothetical protein